METIPESPKERHLADRIEELRAKVNEIVEFLGLLPIDPPPDEGDAPIGHNTLSILAEHNGD